MVFPFEGENHGKAPLRTKDRHKWNNTPQHLRTHDNNHCEQVHNCNSIAEERQGVNHQILSQLVLQQTIK